MKSPFIKSHDGGPLETMDWYYLEPQTGEMSDRQVYHPLKLDKAVRIIKLKKTKKNTKR